MTPGALAARFFWRLLKLELAMGAGRGYQVSPAILGAEQFFVHQRAGHGLVLAPQGLAAAFQAQLPVHRPGPQGPEQALEQAGVAGIVKPGDMGGAQSMAAIMAGHLDSVQGMGLPGY